MRERVDNIQTTAKRVKLDATEALKIRFPRYRKYDTVFIRRGGVRRVVNGVDYIIRRVCHKNTIAWRNVVGGDTV